jgi:glycosyltransferase involved in cell wall biosynthesis
MVEAMAKRKPVVAFDIRSSSEVVDDGISGFLVPPGNVEVMAEKVLELARNKKLRETFGRKGYERVENMFTMGNTIKQVKEFLEFKNGVTA